MKRLKKAVADNGFLYFTHLQGEAAFHKCL